MNDKPQVLIVDDDKEILPDYLQNLGSDEYDLIGVLSLEEAIAALEQQPFDVVIADLDLPPHADGGMQVIKKAKSLDATIGVIMVTGVGGVGDAQRAIRELGARAFFPKPLDFVACRRRIQQAIMERRYRLTAIKAAEEGGFARIRNPYTAGKPLGQNNVMFYGRDEVFDFICDNIGEPSHYNHLALVGPRRIGKTSILQQLPTQMGTTLLPVYINCQSLGIDPGMPVFFLQFSRQIRRGLEMQGLDLSNLPHLTEADLSGNPALNFGDIFWLQLRQVLGDRSLMLCLDEFEELENKVQRGRLDSTIFTFLHDLMLTEAQIVCILAGSRRLEEPGMMSREAASILDLVTYRHVGVFSPDLARRLIEEPVAYSGMFYQTEAVEAILRATGGYPYLIQLLCARLVNHRNEQRRNEMTPADVQTTLAALLETAQPGFFWESLTPCQQAVLICAAQLWPKQKTLTARNVEAGLKEAKVPYQSWEIPVYRLLHELTLEELLREHPGDDGQNMQYSQTFELLSAWVRRHKALDQIRVDIGC